MQLTSYQNEIYAHILAVPKCAIWAHMGAGKTLATLAALARLKAQGVIKRVLVIAPPRVAAQSWPAEVDKWRGLNLTCTNLAPKTAKKRADLAASDTCDIHTISVFSFETLVDYFGADWPYDCVIIDESSLFKSPSSGRFKTMRRLMKTGRVSRLIQLTGTPRPNSLLDIWSQIFLLDAGERLGRSMTQYKAAYFKTDYMGYKFTPLKGSSEAVESKISDIVLSIKPAASVPVNYRNVWVDLPPAARVAYSTLENDYILQLGETAAQVIPSAAVATGKMQQLANGAVYSGDDPDTRVAITAHDAKLDALAGVVGDGPTMVAYTFQSDKARILERFPNAVTTSDPATIEAWCRGEIDMWVVHPQSVGHGLNLQSGGHTVVWFGATWSLDTYLQFNARLARRGQKHPVDIIHILATDTVDAVIMDALASKDRSQNAMREAVRLNILEKRKGGSND